MKTFETAGGKMVQMKYQQGTALIKVEFNPGGELPIELSGLFTDEASAEAAIIKYLDKSSNSKKKIVKE